jgi:hypothetical protein
METILGILGALFGVKATIVGVLFAVVGCLFMEHYDPKAMHSSRRRLVWGLSSGILFVLMCWLFTWLRTGTVGF